MRAKRLLGWIGLMVLALVLVDAVLILLFRMRPQRVVDLVRMFNRRFINPVVLRLAGREGSAFGVISHTGRASGRRYRTPVIAQRTLNDFIVPLPYGTTVDWLRNVQAGGTAALEIEGATYEIGRAELITPAEAEPFLPLWLRHRFHRYGINQYVRLHPAPVTGSVKIGGDAARIAG